MWRGICGTLLLIAAGIACGAGGPAAGATPQVRVAKTVTFHDAAREDPDAPDIRTVVVSNTEASSAASTVITLRVAIPGRPALTEEMRVAIWIDTDSDRATGLAGDAAHPGADYLLNWDRKLRDAARLLRCSATGCRPTSAPTFRFSYRRGATFSMRAAELGDTRGFRFSVRAYDGSSVDVAPREGGPWGYAILVRKPAVPRGGRTLIVRFTVTLADGSVLTRGRVSCTATVGGKRFTPRSARFVGDRATCTFVLPLSAAGKTVRGTITVVSGGDRFTKPFEQTLR